MNNKMINIASICTAVIYAAVQIVGFCVPAVDVGRAAVPSILFISVLALFSAVVALPEKNKKIRAVCMIMAALELLLALVLCINIFAGFFERSDIKYMAIILAGLLLLTTIVLTLVNAEASSYLTKIMSNVCLIVLMMLAVIYIKWDSRPLSASISMTGAAVSLNLLAPRFRNKAVQALTSIASLAFIVIPVVYIARGYIGFYVSVTNVLVIFSVLVSLACTSFIAISGIKAERSSAGAPQTSDCR